ncbi:MAG: hypothetical protein KDD53_00640, partial [Bdellovibrionales bacterium]|nr:hypothetical protein [Bdellovibrionales bacterium]
PVIIVPAYYTCPRLCGLVLNGVLTFLNNTELKLQDDFIVIAVSFDPADTVESAKSHAQALRSAISEKQNSAGWQFFVGTHDSSESLMRQIGYQYFAEGKDFSHSAAIAILTPEGVISQYFFGIEFPERDVRLALVEASRGGIGSILDHIMLYCFRFDPTKGKYTWAVFALLKVLGIVVLLSLSSLLFFLWRRYRQ